MDAAGVYAVASIRLMVTRGKKFQRKRGKGEGRLMAWSSFPYPLPSLSTFAISDRGRRGEKKRRRRSRGEEKKGGGRSRRVAVAAILFDCYLFHVPYLPCPPGGVRGRTLKRGKGGGKKQVPSAPRAAFCG